MQGSKSSLQLNRPCPPARCAFCKCSLVSNAKTSLQRNRPCPPASVPFAGGGCFECQNVVAAIPLYTFTGGVDVWSNAKTSLQLIDPVPLPEAAFTGGFDVVNAKTSLQHVPLTRPSKRWSPQKSSKTFAKAPKRKCLKMLEFTNLIQNFCKCSLAALSAKLRRRWISTGAHYRAPNS